MPTDATRLRAAFAAGVPPPLRALIAEIGAAARDAGTAVYLVGGPVRDLVLGRPPLDIDLAIEGDAIVLARQVAGRHGLRVTTHEAFGTATIALPPGLAPAGLGLDLVSARRETYPAPARLPQVQPADLAADLARRDFTVNALALPLVPAGEVVDPHGGLADLAAGRIRVLHPASFDDDPTRIVRAARYAARLGFNVEPVTAALIAAAVAAHLLDRLTPARWRHEIWRTLAEPDPAPALALLQDWGVLAALHPALAWDAHLAPLLACAPEPAGRLTLLLYRLGPAARAVVTTKLGIDPRPLEELAGLLEQTPALMSGDPVRSAALLRPLRAATLDLYMCLAPPAAGDAVRAFREQWQHVKPLLTGADLQGLGVPPGPRYRVLLEAIRDARLAGRVVSRDDEVALVQRLLRPEAPA